MTRAALPVHTYRGLTATEERIEIVKKKIEVENGRNKEKKWRRIKEKVSKIEKKQRSDKEKDSKGVKIEIREKIKKLDRKVEKKETEKKRKNVVIRRMKTGEKMQDCVKEVDKILKEIRAEVKVKGIRCCIVAGVIGVCYGQLVIGDNVAGVWNK
ncbi:hypothetical protein PUN28_008208 [Cardiocondyla obscurior]|uniref:Uncharacterized protein n=1 Tax=Cardiocondyla obscurior TaxID=286306 RepID=A0AAW2FY68_9HYME